MLQSARAEEPASQREAWLDGGRRRCRVALTTALAAPDRLALLREYARLSDGYLNLSAAGLSLSPEEEESAPAFGLDVQGQLVRIVDTPDLPPSVAQAFRLDSAMRRLFAAGTPDAALLRWTAHEAYRSETQKAAVRAMLMMPLGAALMVSMPTGTGKSLLFQLAPFAWRDEESASCAIVITPTIALALDHERTLKAIPGLEGSRSLTSQLSFSDREEVLNAFRRGEVPLLLMSPEQAFGSARDALLEAAQPPREKFGLKARLNALFIDEAHIVENWGRSFRPDFQRLPGLVQELRQRNAGLRTVLLSATLGPSARAELRRGYGGGDWLEVHAGVPRYEFDLATERYESAQVRDAALIATINSAPRPAIIYTSLVRHARAIHDDLHARGFRRIALFTGEVSDDTTRQSIINDWAADRLDLVVATSAFGMGIDKADVRTVIHASLPEGPARYYQEIGRAARDGRQGSGICMWFADAGDDDDEDQARSLAGGSWISREKAEQRWRAIREWGASQGGLKWHGSRRRMTVNLDAIREGLSGTSSDYNRQWNMSVLNLLQRAGAIEVTGVANPDREVPTWQIEIVNDSLLVEDATYEQLWDQVEALREVERKSALRDLESFRQILLPSNGNCVLSGLFDLIDQSGGMPPDCGRCSVCRDRKIPVPRLVHSGGLDCLWPYTSIGRTPLSTAITMILPDDPGIVDGRSSLLDDLTTVGIEQFVVPDDAASNVARHLADSPCEVGFVLTHSDWLHGKWMLANLPTGIFIPRWSDASEELWRALKRERQRHPDQRYIIIAPADLKAEGRPMAQVVSKHAPYSQEAFRTFAAFAVR